MLGTIIRNLGKVVYQYPVVPQDRVCSGAFGQLKVALVADYFTSACLAVECRIRSLTPSNYRDIIINWQPDLVLVESAFHGVRGEWRYKLAKQPKYLRLSKPQTIGRLVRLARERGIPTVFWNKDDGAFFEAFIDVACLFEQVFTTDNRSIARYASALPQGSTARLLVMPYQPAFHNFTGFAFEKNAACFVGSYYSRILHERREFLDMIFDACVRATTPVHVFDRNAHRLSHYFEFRFPRSAQLHMHASVPYAETAHVYKKYGTSFNVNSVTDTDTMVSRRLLEILACGGILVTNKSPAVEQHFQDFCHVVDSAEHAQELLARLRFGPSVADKERAAAGAVFVHTAHTWERRLEQLSDILNF